EFIGLSGSGKTTMAETLYKRVKKNSNVEMFNLAYLASIERYYNNLGLLKKYRYKLLKNIHKEITLPADLYQDFLFNKLIRERKLLSEIISYIGNNAPDKRKKYLLKYLFYDDYKLNVIENNNQGYNTVIMDEGFVHRIANILMYLEKISEKKNLMNAYFDLYNYNLEVIYIKSDIEESIDRMNKRKKGIPQSFRGLKTNELYKELSMMKNSFEILINY